MHPRPYPELDVTDWELVDREQMGSQPYKQWLRDGAPAGTGGDQVKWLFKPRSSQPAEAGGFPKGDDWAEKVVSEVARTLQIPTATVELARRESDLGIVSRDVSAGRDLVPGNVVLGMCNPAYPQQERHRVRGYTLAAVFEAFAQLEVAPPLGTPPGQDAASVFTSYLVLDALVGNTDRHHENWALLDDAASGLLLAPTFDHASSLGFLLSDDERVERLRTKDLNRSVGAYAARGASRHVEGRPSLVTLAAEAVRTTDGHDQLLSHLDRCDEDDLSTIVERVPETRMSQPSRMFASTLLVVNRRRLLDAIDNAR